VQQFLRINTLKL